MKPNPWQHRRGLSLMEVLVSFFVMLVGVVAVITLFPVGVLAVQRAVLDTRTTIVALDAQATVQMRNWLDDRYFIQPPHRGILGAGAPLDQPNPAAGDARGLDGATLPPFTGARPSSETYPPPPAVATTTVPALNNLYATIPLANGQMPMFPGTVNAPAPERFHPVAGAGPGFPIFCDPVLYNSTQFQFDSTTPLNTPIFKRVAIAAPLTVAGQTFSTMAPFAGALNDLVIAPLSDIQYQPATNYAVSPNAITQRDQYMRQMFFSNDLGHMEETLATAPYNPNREFQSGGTYLPSWRYQRSGDSSAFNTPATWDPPGAGSPDTQKFNTTSKNLDYSWSFVVRNRQLHPQPASATLGTPPMPPYLVPRTGEWSNENVVVMVYHKRAIERGYHLVRGCFFNGSGIATLSWDASMPSPPSVVKGTWLMEATISPGLRDTTAGPSAGVAGPAPLPPSSDLIAAVPPVTPATNYVKYRHAIEFYRVASVQDPVLDQTSGQMHQVVNLEKPVTNYPISHALGDGRALPDLYQPETFSGSSAYPNVLPGDKLVPTGAAPFAAPGGTVETVWVPVIIWHGLAEVFTARN